MVAIAPNLIGEADARGVEVIPSSSDDRFKGHSGDSVAAQTPEPSAKAQKVAQAETEPVSLSLEQMEMTGKSTDVTTNFATKSTKGFVPRGDDYGLDTFNVIYMITNEGDGDVRNVELLIESDFETVQAKLIGKLDPKHSVVSATIKAIDYASITAQIVGWS
jgi:hypothetical protein